MSYEAAGGIPAPRGRWQGILALLCSSKWEECAVSEGFVVPLQYVQGQAEHNATTQSLRQARREDRRQSAELWRSLDTSERDTFRLFTNQNFGYEDFEATITLQPIAPQDVVDH